MVTSNQQIPELVEHLKRVPPKDLAIITLAWELVGPEGQIDVNQVQFRIEEVMLARDEAVAYTRATQRMVEALKQCLS
jgi:hypothetical protein